MNTITLASTVQAMDQFRALTGKTCGTYICGPKAYAALKEVCSVPANERQFYFYGARVFESQFCPDDGEFYPADYLEGAGACA